MIRMASWNMQRGDVSLARSPQLDVANARAEFLIELVKKFEVIFIQEAPQDLFRQARERSDQSVVQSAIVEGRRLYANNIDDTQAEANGCRCVLIAPSGGEILQDRFMSGGEGFRFPVSVHWGTRTSRILTSAHFTSGDNAAWNARGYLESINPIKLAKVQRWVWVIGADFNFSTRDNNRGIFQAIAQPDQPTHQSGSILDGFFVGHSEDGKVAHSKADRWITAGHTAFFTTDHPGPNGQVGFHYGRQRESALGRRAPELVLYKISDHAPVWFEVEMP